MAEKKERITVHAEPIQRVSDDSPTITPLIDVYEMDDDMTMLVAEVPGASPGSVDIRVDKGVLTIEAQAELPEISAEYTRTYVGFPVGRYFRAFALSDEIDRDKIDATLANGLLTLRMPRAAAAKTRKIDIKVE